MKLKKLLTILTLVIASYSINAEDVNVKGLELIKGKTISAINVKLSANLSENPELSVVGKTIELKIPNARVSSKISKKIGTILLTATQYDRNTVKVVANLPSSLKGQESLVSIVLKDNALDLSFPFSEIAGRAPAIVTQTKEANQNLAKSEEILDENYLKTLEAEEAKKVTETTAKAENKIEAQINNTDRVKLTQSSVTKSETSVTNSSRASDETPKSSFSIATYVGKFVAFLGIILLGFYGVLTLFKKGVIKKGKLGFLNSTKLVEVLSTTHVAPKKSLIMVKAHKQVFLISNCENGMSLISEINDVTGLIKNGEAEITGTNFDTNLNSATKTNKEFRLKEDYVDYESLDEMLNEPELGQNAETSASKSITKNPVKDTVKFSEQIKSKVKNLKQLS